MGKIKNTTNYVNTTMLFKSKLTKNFSDDNYWIEGLQNKVDKAWVFATDVVDIQEEIDTYNNKGYRLAKPHYKKTEVRITSAYDETGQKLSNDYKNINEVIKELAVDFNKRKIEPFNIFRNIYVTQIIMFSNTQKLNAPFS